MSLHAATDVEAYQTQVANDGFSIVDPVLSNAQVEQLRDAVAAIPAGEEVRRRGGVFGIRNLLELCDACRELAIAPEIRALVTPILGEHCLAVRATFFDKVPGANWNLRWHQDCTITVDRKIDVEGFHAWAVKAGVVHVRPPVKVLQQMLAIRVHLDDCAADNGALRILKGSHNRRWEREKLDEAKAAHEAVLCPVPLGGVMAMRPLAVHASSAAESPDHRRVIHLEFAGCDLPQGLQWKNRLVPE